MFEFSRDEKVIGVKIKTLQTGMIYSIQFKYIKEDKIVNESNIAGNFTVSQFDLVKKAIKAKQHFTGLTKTMRVLNY